jgi:bacterioferritin
MSTDASPNSTNQLAIDISRIREDARSHMDAGAVTAGNTIDVNRLIDVLNEVVATEIVCYLRYSQHAIAATGPDRTQVGSEFREHASDENAARHVGRRTGEPTRRRPRFQSRDANAATPRTSPSTTPI